MKISYTQNKIIILAIEFFKEAQLQNLKNLKEDEKKTIYKINELINELYNNFSNKKSFDGYLHDLIIVDHVLSFLTAEVKEITDSIYKEFEKMNLIKEFKKMKLI